MKLRLEATPEEFESKSDQLLKSLQEELVDLAPELADQLEKSIPKKLPELRYQVLRDLSNQTTEEYKKTLDRMLKEIGAVLDKGPVVKSEHNWVAYMEDPNDLTKGWICGFCGARSPDEPCEHMESLAKALYIGPRGGKWADPAHTIPWDPKKHGKQISMFGGKVPPKKVKPKEPDVSDVIKNDPALTTEQKALKQSEALKSIKYAIRQGAAASLDEWGIPSGARIEDPWERKKPDPTQKWSHPDYGEGKGAAPWQELGWTPDFHKYDYVVINSSAGKDSQAMLSKIVELADKAKYPREKLLVVHADLGRVEWEGTLSLAKEQAEHYGLRFEVVQRQQNDLIEQIEERYGTLSQRNTDAAVLVEAGIQTWKQLYESSVDDIVSIIGKGRGTSRWDGKYRAEDMIKRAKGKRDALANKHLKKINSKESAVAKAKERVGKAKGDDAKQKARDKYNAVKTELDELKAMGDPWDWPISYGKPIPWPSTDARFCTSDHKTVEVDKLLTKITSEAKEAEGLDRPVRVLNALGIRAQESANREKMDNFGKQKATRNQDIDRWYPIHQWSEKEVWEEIAKSGVPFHKAYALGMRRLSCVFCVYASREDLMIAAVHNPDLFNTYLELEEKVGSEFRKGQSLSEVANEIKRRRDNGYELNDLAEWVKKSLELDVDTDLVKSTIESANVEGSLIQLVLIAGLQRLRRKGQEIRTLTLEWKSKGVCVHLDTTIDSHHIEFVDYPQAYNASMVAAVFAQQYGLQVEEHNAPGSIPTIEPVKKSFFEQDYPLWIVLDETVGKLLWESLEKGGSRSHKYIRREPYVNPKTGKRGYRYYYRESAIGRAAKEGTEVKLGADKTVKVVRIREGGDIVLQEGESEPYVVSTHVWGQMLADHYGGRFYEHAEQRARQAISAVLRHVPGKLLADLKGKTDKERLEDLKKRVPEVYKRLEASFQRAGVDPFQAKEILNNSLKRKGWDQDARALVLGAIVTPEGAKLAKKHTVLMDAAENLAGGRQVEESHAAVAIDLVQANVVEVAKRAERELEKLQSILQGAKSKAGDIESKAALLAQSMASRAVQKLNELAKAFPGLADKTVEPSRKAILEIPSHSPSVPKNIGASAYVYVAGEGGKPKALNARYELKEANQVYASHDPKDFKQVSKYPENVQERAYHRDKAEQLKVIRNAQAINPEFMINTNPDAVNGPPIITEDGVVLGGNSRTMSMQRAYYDKGEPAEKLKSYLKDHAHEVGLNPADVEAMENPVLVRVVDVPDRSTRNLQLLVRAMNESFTQAMDPRTMQVALGRRLDDSTLDSLANNMGEDETLNQFLSTGKSGGFVNSLYRAGIIDDRNSNQYMMKGSRRLNSDGKVLVARVLAGRVLDNADLLSDTKPSIVESVAVTAPYLVKAAGSGTGYDLSGSIQVALDGYNRLQEKVYSGDIPFALDAKVKDNELQSIMSTYFNDLFGEVHPVMNDPRAQSILELLVRRSGVNQMRNVFREYAKLAAANPEGQGQLLGGKLSPNEVLDLAIDTAKNKEAKEAAEIQAKKRKKKEPELFAASDSSESDLEKSHKYIRRWKDKAGKWQYEYPEDKQSQESKKQESEEKPIWKIAKIRDLRPIDWDSGKRIPLDPADCATCDRCGRKHQVVYEMHSSDGNHALVGSGCGPKMAGGAEYIDQKSLREAKKAEDERVRNKAQEKTDNWENEIFEAHLANLPEPEITVSKEPSISPWDKEQGTIPKNPLMGYLAVVGNNEATSFVPESTYVNKEEQQDQSKRHAALNWVKKKADQAMEGYTDIPTKWHWWIGKGTNRETKHVKYYIRDKLASRLYQKLFSHLFKSQDLSDPIEHDYTQDSYERDRRAFLRVKQVLKQKGYTDKDFEEGGSLFGLSINQLIDEARGKE